VKRRAGIELNRAVDVDANAACRWSASTSSRCWSRC